MLRDIRQTLTLRMAGISAMLLCVASVPGAVAADHRFGYPSGHYFPYEPYGVHENFRLRREMNDLNDQMRRQQRLLDEQIRQQQEQTRLLRQQQSMQQRVTVGQACYYRLDGGLNLCDRLFDAASKKHAACVETAIELNPECAADIAGSSTRSGG